MKKTRTTRSPAFKFGVLGVVGIAVVVVLWLFGRKPTGAGADAAADALLTDGASDASLATTTAREGGASTAVTATDAAETRTLASLGALYTHLGDSAEEAKTTLYELEGVDLERRRAWVRHQRTKPTPLFEILTVDYDKSPPTVDRWVAKDEAFVEWSTLMVEGASKTGYRPAFHAISGTMDDDLAKYGDIVRRAGPWSTRRRTLAPQFAASNEAVLYGALPNDKSDGDWLYLAGKDGKGGKRFDVGMTASYDPVFSPDGKRVATRACGKKCDYYLYITPVTGGAPVKVTGVSDPRGAPLFTPDGKSVLALTHGAGDKGGCLWRVSVEGQPQENKLHCMADAFADVDAIIDEHAESALVCGKKSEVAGLVCVWLTLPDGASKGTLHTTGRVDVLSRGGLALSGIAGGVRVYDLASSESRTLSNVDLELSSARFATDGELVALRRDAPDGVHGAGFTIVRIDVRKLMTELPKDP
jgi:hypothetical protein